MTSTPSSPSSSTSGSTSNGVPWQVLTIVAIALIIIYVLVDTVLLARANNADTGENVWNRYVVLLKGFEALTFTAVGWLFGREINRGAAEQATEAKGKVEEAKVEAATERTKGHALAHAVTTSAEAAPPAQVDGIGGAGAATPGDSQLASIKNLAERLYPNL